MNNLGRTIHIKKEILVRIIKAFLSDNFEEQARLIPYDMRPKGMEVPYRCCVYKERAIIRSRTLAGLGFSIEEDDETVSLAKYAKKALDLNVYFSFAGNLTYRNARNLHETVMNIPVERILIETESPFMIPAEYRDKKRTMPAYLPSTAKFLAEMLDMDVEALSEQLWKNSCKAFNLPE